MTATARRPLALAASWASGVAAVVLLVSTVSASAAGAQTVKVWFLQGEQMIALPREGATAEDAMRQLLAGPTPTEAKRGVETYVPKGTKLRSVSVANGVATVDLSLKFALGSDSASLLARLSQVVHTATGPEGAKRVRLLVQGGVPLGMFPGVSLAGRAITVDYLKTPNVPTPKPPAGKPQPVDAQVRSVQQRLAQLGFLLAKDVDGQAGPLTDAAVLAFQKWEGLGRDGDIGPQTLRRLQAAKRPGPLTRGGSGRRAEVLLDRQVALAIQNDKVVRVLHVSTGAPSTPTPPGDFEVYAKIQKWWSVPFREWLLWAVPFNGGIAFHELAEVPPYPASHGCVRERYGNAKWMYDFSRVGMPVKVLARS